MSCTADLDWLFMLALRVPAPVCVYVCACTCCKTYTPPRMASTTSLPVDFANTAFFFMNVHQFKLPAEV